MTAEPFVLAQPVTAPRHVAAVVVTHKRPRLATEVVRGLTEHELLSPERIVLVVNGDGGLADEQLEKQVHVLRLGDNPGPAGGFREGMRFAATLPRVEWFYLCEDDVGLFDLPSPRLARLVADAESMARTRRVGAIVAYGRDLHRLTGHTTVHEVSSDRGYDRVDAASWGASLVSRRVLEADVLPVDDYFFGYEDFDFWYQMRAAGFEVLVDRESAHGVARQMTLSGRDRAFAGERPSDDVEPWRAFYVARNYFLLARRHGSPAWVAAHLAYSARRLQLARSPAERRAIVRGLAAGLRRRRGKDQRYLRELGELGAAPRRAAEQAAASRPVVLHVLPRDVARGAQVFVRDLCAVLEQEDPGRSHVVLTLFRAPESVLAGAHTLGVQMGRLRRMGFDPRVPVALRRAAIQLEPQVIVAHGGESLKYLAAVPGLRPPVVYLAIGTVADQAKHGLRRILYRYLVSRPRLVAGVSRDTLHELEQCFALPPGNGVLLPNGRDATRYSPALLSDEQAGSDAVTLLFVGHLTESKRPERFVAAVRELRERGLPVRGLLAGDGPLEHPIRRPADSSGVEVLGRRDDVPQLMRAADVLVLCSVPEGEGLPGVLIEAALSGLPIVTTDVPGARDVVLDGVTGFVVPPDDDEALVGALAGLVGDAPRRAAMGAAARARAEQEFDLAALARRWRSLLDDVGAAALDR